MEHFTEYYVQRSVHRTICSDNYPTRIAIYSLFISVNCSTCFGWYLHPPSGAHINVSTVSGISETVTATCGERDWMETGFLMMGGDNTRNM